MKKALVFLAIAMIAGAACAQTFTWMGNSAIYCVEDTAWYNGDTVTWGSADFDGYDFGLVSTLTLGGETQLYYSPDGSYPQSATVTMDYQVDSLGVQSVSYSYLENTGNNEKWQNMVGEDVIAGSGLSSAGAHTVAVWFTGVDGATTLYDNNSAANYIADFSTAAVPEPATMSLLGLGALAMVLRRKMRK